jgi:hypothetical protein
MVMLAGIVPDERQLIFDDLAKQNEWSAVPGHNG